MKLQENDFVILPKLSLSLRFFIDILMISLAFYLQTLNNTGTLILSGIVLIFFIIFNWIRKLEITKDFEGKTFKWESTTIDEFREAYKKVRKISGISTQKGSAMVYFTFAIIILSFIGPLLLDYDPLLFALCVDIAVIGFVIYSSGNRYIWTPKGFKKKLYIYLFSHRYILSKWGNKYYIEPQFYLEENQKKYVPLDAKLLLKTKDKPPEGFLAVQYQISMNDVQGKSYPYFYSVIIAKKEFGLIKKFQKRRATINELVNKIGANVIFRAKSQKDDIEILIIRQTTTKTSGYYTKDKTIKKIISLSILILDELLKE